MLVNIMVVGLGGFIGAVLRFLMLSQISSIVPRMVLSGMISGVLLVNIIGCLIVGALIHWIDGNHIWRLFFMMGVLGSFTTFSAFGQETLEMVRQGSFFIALANILGHFILALGATFIGYSTISFFDRIF